MKNPRTNTQNIPALVPLERRRLFAGNVTAVWTDDGSFDGLLTITGDNKANQFIVSASGIDTTVTGLNGTKINGGTAIATFDFYPNLVIDTGNGDDEVEVLDMFSALSVKTGNGNDRVAITEADALPLAFDHFDIDTGNGNDRVELTDLTCFECDMNIKMGNGDDSLKLVGTIALTGIFGTAGIGTVNMGNGHDTIDETSLVDYVAPDPLVVIGNETLLT
jgi:hypothetical protein